MNVFLAVVVFAVVGTFATFLLGIRLPWVLRLVAAFVGFAAGGTIAWFLADQATRRIDPPVVLIASLTAGLIAAAVLTLVDVPGRLARMGTTIVRLPRLVGAGRRRLRRGRRYTQVVSIAMRNGLLDQPRGEDADGDMEATAAAGPTRRRATALRATLEDAGGAFVKLGQLLSTRPDLLPPDLITELARLQDDVAPEPPGRIDALLTQELGTNRDRVFAEFDPQPLAAASIAQVHRARLVSGEWVAVKVQRPGVRAVVERDLDIARKLARTIEERTAWGRELRVSELADGFATALLEELDFGVEARNTTTCREALERTAIAAGGRAGHARVRVPRVHHELSTRRLLVLEWIDGEAVGRAGPLIEANNLDRTALARSLLRAVLVQIMVHGTFHADPHPGNVFVQRDGTVTLIDLGSVGRIDSLQQSALLRAVLAIAQADPRQLRDALLDIASTRSGADEDLLERALAQFLVTRLGEGMVPDPRLFADLFRMLVDFGLAFPPAIGAVFRALGTLDGTLRTLDPAFNIIEEAKDAADGLVGDIITPQAVPEAFIGEALSLLPVLRRLPRRIDRIASATERGDLNVNVRLLADERDVRMFNGMLNRALLVVLATALGLVSSQLIDTTSGPVLTQTLTAIQMLGYIGLATSAVLFLRAIIAVLGKAP